MLVAFVDRDPSRPQVVAFEESDGSGFLPLTLSLDATTVVKLADGLLPMAKTGDFAGGVFPIVGTTRVLG